MRKFLNFIKNHFLLRNIILAICIVIVGVWFVNFMLSVYTRHGQRMLVPDLSGMSVEDANSVITADSEMVIIVSDSLYLPKLKPGQIIDQNPKANSGVKSGRKIFVTINAMQPVMEVMPYVVGVSLRQAKNTLESKGFEISRLKYRDDIATNYILEQYVDGANLQEYANKKYNLGAKVELVVGRNLNSQLPIVPNVIGLSLRQAKSRLWEVGLNIGDIIKDSSVDGDEMDVARVYKQTPNQTSRADFGSSVKLYLTQDKQKVVEGEKDSRRKLDEMQQIEVENEDEFESAFGL